MPFHQRVRHLFHQLGGGRVTARGLLLTFALLVVGSAAVISQLLPESGPLAAPVAILVGGGGAGSLMVLGARSHVGRERLAWTVVGLGCLLAAAGVLAVGLIGLLAGSVPAFGPTDLIFMTAYAAVLAGFFMMPHLGPVLNSRTRVMLDGMIGAGAMATLVWILFFAGLQERLLTATSWEQFAGVTYPILDSSMVVVAMIVTIRRSAWRFDPRVVAFGFGMCLQAMGDLGLLATGIGQDLTQANPNYLLYLGAMACYLTTGALIRRRPRPREYADRRQPLWAMLAPYGVAFVVIAVIANRLTGRLPGESLVLVLAALGLVVLVVVRQAVALREYRNLVHQQRSALVASVSHELRTPLTAMVGFLDILQDDHVQLEREERHELTEVVYQQAIYMSAIVSDLLLLARNSDGLQLEPSETNVGRLIADTLRSLVAQARVDTEVAPHLIAQIDAPRIRQVLSNLVVNAVRYGRGKVLVVASRAGGDLLIEVHDNGDGVPRRYELAIWQQFERGAHRLNASIPGSGIGLAVVDLIVRRHGGTVGYERSKRLGGACFRISLAGSVRSEVPEAAMASLAATTA